MGLRKAYAQRRAYAGKYGGYESTRSMHLAYKINSGGASLGEMYNHIEIYGQLRHERNVCFNYPFSATQRDF